MKAAENPLRGARGSVLGIDGRRSNGRRQASGLGRWMERRMFPQARGYRVDQPAATLGIEVVFRLLAESRVRMQPPASRSQARWVQARGVAAGSSSRFCVWLTSVLALKPSACAMFRIANNVGWLSPLSILEK